MPCQDPAAMECDELRGCCPQKMVWGVATPFGLPVGLPQAEVLAHEPAALECGELSGCCQSVMVWGEATPFGLPNHALVDAGSLTRKPRLTLGKGFAPVAAAKRPAS